jgi:hypothetical protein
VTLRYRLHHAVSSAQDRKGNLWLGLHIVWSRDFKQKWGPAAGAQIVQRFEQSVQGLKVVRRPDLLIVL